MFELPTHNTAFRKQLVIIRHARSALNVRLSEDLDCPITEYGRLQAENVGKFLSKHVDLSGADFFTSPFLRCLETSKYIANYVGYSKFNVSWPIREYINHAGREVFVPRRAEYERDPQFHYGAYEDTTFNDESNELFLNRIQEFHAGLPASSVVITHGLPAMVLIHVASRSNVNYIPVWDHSIDNCSITLIKNGRVVWYGRNLTHEMENDIFEQARPYDAADLLIPGV